MNPSETAARLDQGLFTPTRIGAIAVPNRIVMAPMTRSRAGADAVPTALMAAYYAQRATAGLIIAEMTHVSPDGRSNPGTPGIHDEAQVAGWRAVTNAVHRAGGRIFLQIAHAGRISHPSIQPGGTVPVAPSAVAPAGTVHTLEGMRPFVTPRALTTQEVGRIVDAFAAAAARARDAGFDGIELHAANGYLLDQFLRDGSNRRTDRYGGRAANRVRLLMEVAEAAVAVWSAGRVGVRISPSSDYNDMTDSHPAATFAHAAHALSALPLAYLHVVEPLGAAGAADRMTPALGRLFGGPMIVNGGYTRAAAQAAVRSGEATAVAFGTSFLANPDLPSRMAAGAPLNMPDTATFYQGGSEGYVDYPTLDPAQYTRRPVPQGRRFTQLHTACSAAPHDTTGR